MAQNNNARSIVWKYFTKEQDNKAQCLRCHIKLSYKGSTSNLRNHLKFKHPGLNLDSTLTINNDNTTTTTTSSTSCDDVQSRQRGINTYMISSRPINPIPIYSTEWQTMTRKIAEFCARDMRPLSLVNGQGFIDMMNTINPRYQVPCHTTIKNYINKMYITEKNELIDQLKIQPFLSLTTDAWTSSATEAYTTLTAHYLDNNWKPFNCVLSTHETVERHTGVNLADDIRGVLADFGVAEVPILGITTDNASNMDVCVKNLGFPHIRCFGHSLQLTVKAGIDLPFVSHAAGAGRRIVTFFHKSTVASNALKLKQEQLETPSHRLIQDVATRWNSTYYMFERLIEQRLPIMAVIHDSSIVKPSDARVMELSDKDWRTMEDTINILKPFEMATTIASAQEYPTIGMVYPIVYGLIKKHLHINDHDSPDVVRMKNSISASLTKRYLSVTDDQLCASPQIIASALDPRYKHLLFLPKTSQRTKVWEIISEKLVQNVQNIVNIDPDLDTSPPPNKKAKSALDFLVGTFDVSGSQDVLDSTEACRAEREISCFKSEDVCSSNTCPLEWWKLNECRYLLLSKLAKKMLGIPATSVPSERVFSTAGNTVTAKRSNLDPDTVDRLIFLKEALNNKIK